MNPFPSIDDVIEYLTSQGMHSMARIVMVERAAYHDAREANRALRGELASIGVPHAPERRVTEPAYRAPPESDG
jgi:hypothetical protein